MIVPGEERLRQLGDSLLLVSLWLELRTDPKLRHTSPYLYDRVSTQAKRKLDEERFTRFPFAEARGGSAANSGFVVFALHADLAFDDLHQSDVGGTHAVVNSDERGAPHIQLLHPG